MRERVMFKSTLLASLRFNGAAALIGGSCSDRPNGPWKGLQTSLEVDEQSARALTARWPIRSSRQLRYEYVVERHMHLGQLDPQR